MTKNDTPRLCGGTFFTQLLLSRKPTVSQRQRTQGETDVFHNEDVLFALLQIVQPDAIKPTGNSFETYTTNFKKCDGSIGEDLKFENESVRSAFTKRLTDDYPSVVNTVAGFCADYIDTRETPRNHEKLVKRLIEVISDDETIMDDDLFQIGKNGYKANKKALGKVTEVSLPDFLLSVWAFVALKRNDNSVGRNTIVVWSDPNTKGRYIGNDGTRIQQDISVSLPAFEEPAGEDASAVEDETYAEYSDPYEEQPTPEPAPHTTTQIINSPAVFFNSGANGIQINNTGTLNIDRGGKT
ncbi:hypothetical protein FACS1894132_05730 [Clostridia bacterium]|nr:hypothetical protein FACS1894132_05730 [Clostridia bacterium]